MLLLLEAGEGGPGVCLAEVRSGCASLQIPGTSSSPHATSPNHQPGQHRGLASDTSVYSIRMYSFNKIGRSEPSKGSPSSTERLSGHLALSPLPMGSEIRDIWGPHPPCPLAKQFAIREERGEIQGVCLCLPVDRRLLCLTFSKWGSRHNAPGAVHGSASTPGYSLSGKDRSAKDGGTSALDYLL